MTNNDHLLPENKIIPLFKLALILNITVMQEKKNQKSKLVRNVK